ncbi:hypothetical protein FN976_19745 [Caenimonas sedimenti]|uniref:Transmembrane protein n=1 Tax=Caenimonas sedimenti TaxID=2596921 RepID=A0A562ZLS3_9BURK|nr:DUF6622 family protein [Caenimonas sedimenti]TWO69520.1 hypothetical protein FN976_19745 [Caenimonas sedimenti]
MLLQLIANHPEAVVTVIARTPTWVWGLLAALLALGISQLRARHASLVRIAIMPIAMAGFALFSMAADFRASGALAWALGAWLAAAALVSALIGVAAPAAGTRYDAASRTFALPGSAVPLLLILGIFLTKYVVGIELAMQPALKTDFGFAVSISALYGVFNGLFTGRAVRLLRLAFRPAASLSTVNA